MLDRRREVSSRSPNASRCCPLLANGDEADLPPPSFPKTGMKSGSRGLKSHAPRLATKLANESSVVVVGTAAGVEADRTGSSDDDVRKEASAEDSVKEKSDSDGACWEDDDEGKSSEGGAVKALLE